MKLILMLIFILFIQISINGLVDDGSKIVKELPKSSYVVLEKDDIKIIAKNVRAVGNKKLKMRLVVENKSSSRLSKLNLDIKFLNKDNYLVGLKNYKVIKSKSERISKSEIKDYGILDFYLDNSRDVSSVKISVNRIKKDTI